MELMAFLVLMAGIAILAFAGLMFSYSRYSLALRLAKILTAAAGVLAVVLIIFALL